MKIGTVHKIFLNSQVDVASSSWYNNGWWCRENNFCRINIPIYFVICLLEQQSNNRFIVLVQSKFTTSHAWQIKEDLFDDSLLDLVCLHTPQVHHHSILLATARMYPIHLEENKNVKTNNFFRCQKFCEEKNLQRNNVLILF